MFVACDWLSHYIDHQASADTIAEILTNTGLEVEDQQTFTDQPPHLEDLIIGEVRQVEPHPDADNLSITYVDVGGDEALQIICGAPNVAKGQKVVVAPVGTTIQHVNGQQLTIKQTKIRGVRSYGMLVAEDEIGLSHDHEGIMVLDDQAAIGKAFTDYMQFPSQVVLEIALTPNRGDAASHIGVARDLSAYLDYPLVKPDVSTFKEESNTRPLQLHIENPGQCPRYTGLVIDGVNVGPSPDWLQHHLKAVGLQPINNIVDVTNFVMMEMGHPLHAFDYHAIEGETLSIKQAEAGAKLTTLDGAERLMEGEELLIRDKQKPLAMAGIMGGQASAVTEGTSALFLESAHFDATTVRKGATIHNLTTDAAFRFERGTDPEATADALKRAALLISEVAGGKATSAVMDAYPAPVSPVRLSLSYAYLDRLLGDQVPRERVQRILERLGFDILDSNEEGLTLSVPTFRPDVTRPVDVVEEVMRIYSLNALGDEQLPTVRVSHKHGHTGENLRQKLARYLAGQGFMEMITPPFTSQAAEENLLADYQAGVHVVNPLNQAQDRMRSSCLPSGLEVISYNTRRKQTDLKLFELGKIYQQTDNQPVESEWLSLFLTGYNHAPTWYQPAQEVDFYQLKGVVYNLLHLAGLSNWQENRTSSSNFQYGLNLTIANETVAYLGGITPKLLKAYSLKQPVLYAALSTDFLIQAFQAHTPQFSPISKYPQIERDLALLVPEQTPYQAIKETIWQAGIPELVRLNLFDVYRGANVAEGYQSLAIRLILQDEQKTMEDDRIDNILQQLVQKLYTETGATIRQ